MYSSDRIKWWLERSRSIEYQRAYDAIVRNILKVEGGIYVDVACGSGECIKRLAQGGNHRLIVGTDASSEMLEAAQANLTSVGIESSVLEDPSKISSASGVVLVLDDILESQLPNDFADRVLFVFPELGTEYTPKRIDRKLRDKAVIADIKSEDKSEAPVTLRAEHHLSRMTRKEGFVYIVSYDLSQGAGSAYDRKSNEMHTRKFSITNLRLEGDIFVLSYRLWNDTIVANDDAICKYGLSKGYRMHRTRRI